MTSLDDFTLYASGLVASLSLICLIGWGICWFYLEHRPKPAPKTPLSKVYADMWDARKKLTPADQEWFDAVSNQAGIHMPVPDRISIPVPKQTLNLSKGTPTGQIIEVGDIKYQRYSTTNGFFYLEELPRAQEEVHEESTTARDIAGRSIAEHHRTCTSCSTNLPDGVREPARLDPALQLP